MNNENSQAQVKSHVGGNNKLGINFAWPNLAFDNIEHDSIVWGRAD